MSETIFLRETSPVNVRIGRKAKERRERLLKEVRCLGCEKQLTERDVVRRGLCSACYQSTLVAIGRRTLSEVEAVRTGVLLPPSKGGRKPSNPYTKKLSGR